MHDKRHARWLWAGLVATGLGGLSLGADQPPPNRLPVPETPLPAPAPSLLTPEAAPIDLASALRLGGIRNPEILLARTQVDEAVALRQLAAAQFLPTINAGASFDSHTGSLQQSTGEVIKLNRGSVDAGLGTGAVGAGTVPIPGIVLSGNVSEGIYRTLVSRQVVRQREFASDAVRNDVLLQVARAYLELLRAEGHRVLTLQARDETREVARVTGNFAQTGKGRQADADRAATELELRESEYLRAEEDVLTSSARLCQLLNLDPSTRLHATDGWVVPTPLVPNPAPLPELLAIALSQRPELRERQAAIRAAMLYLDGAKLLPFSPNVILGYSAGTFGGGSNLAADGIPQANGTVLQQSRFDNFAGREDFDAIVYWSLRNLGVGNVALIREARSNLRSEQFRQIEVLDRVRTEIAVAYTRTHTRFAQIDHGERGVNAAAEAFREDLDRTRNVVGLPIEVLDSLRLLRLSRNLYLDSIIDYNVAQFELYVALGQPPAACLARAVPAKLVPPPEPCPPIALPVK